MSKLSALLEGAKDIDPRSQSSADYFPPDFQGLLEIMKYIHMTSKDRKELTIAEFKILESNIPDSVPVGSERAWVHNLGDPNFGLKNAKSFVGAVAGLADDSAECKALDQDDMESAMTTPMLIGKHVRVKTHNRVTKMGKNFTVHVFSPAE